MPAVVDVSHIRCSPIREVYQVTRLGREGKKRTRHGLGL
jgi:hypothetical protein